MALLGYIKLGGLYIPLHDLRSQIESEDVEYAVLDIDSLPLSDVNWVTVYGFDQVVTSGTYHNYFNALPDNIFPTNIPIVTIETIDGSIFPGLVRHPYIEGSTPSNEIYVWGRYTYVRPEYTYRYHPTGLPNTGKVKIVATFQNFGGTYKFVLVYTSLDSNFDGNSAYISSNFFDQQGNSFEIYYKDLNYENHLKIYSEIPPAPSLTTIIIEPSEYALTFGQSNVYNIHGYKDGQLVEGIEFEVGPLPEEARGVTLIYPFDDDYTKCRVKMPYISDGVVPDDFEVPVQYDGIVRTFKVDFYGHGDPYTPGGGSGIPSGSGGGGGTFPSSPGSSLVDKIPSGQTGNDIAKSGMFTMYLMNQQYMDLMGDIFWEDNLGITVLKEIFGNPIDSVISTTSYPFNLVNLASSANQNLFFGPWNTKLPFIALTKSSFQIDWGTIEIQFAWGNFLDYSPYTKMELFLPWGPGYVTIDPNDVSPYSNTPGNFNVSTFSSGSIQVKTNIELGKGTCVHNVIGNNGRVIGSYSGIVGKQVPLTALDTGGKALTTIGAVAGLVGGAAVGSLAAKGALDTGRMTAKPVQDPMRPFESSSYWDIGAISGRSTAQSMVSTGANLASRAISSTPITFPRAGTFSDGSSAMTVQEPFLIISRPVQSVPTQYGHYNGYPSNIHVANLNAVSGYTELAEIHLDNVTATADELQELDAILKGGILL